MNRRYRRFRNLFSSVPALSLLALLGWFLTGGVASASATTSTGSLAPRDQLRQELRAHVGALASDAMEGRAVGSMGSAAARAYLVDQLEETGAQFLSTALTENSFEHPFQLPKYRRIPQGTNVVAYFPSGSGDPPDRSSEDLAGGTATPLIVVTAHYDHLGVRNEVIFNGADDNASGVAALLEIAERLDVTATKSDVLVAFLDAEEKGLLGAKALLASLDQRDRDRLAFNLNLDMIGRSDHGVLYLAGASHHPPVGALVGTLLPNSSVDARFGHDTGSGANNWTKASDHAVFHAAGVPFLYFGVEDHDDYHQPTDDVERIDFEFLRGATELVWRTLLVIDGHSRLELSGDHPD